MTREQGWRFLDIGRRIERSLMVMSIIRTLVVPVYSPVVENAMLEACLVSNESLITYRRRYRSYLQLTTVLELLLFDDANPRSLIFQLNRMTEHVQLLPTQATAKHMTELERLILEASTQLRLNEAAALAQPDREAMTHQALDQLLARLSRLISQMSNVITETYFTSPVAPHQLVGTYNEENE
jgi:uncharacterized alpha-E superfamily protein